MSFLANSTGLAAGNTITLDFGQAASGAFFTVPSTPTVVLGTNFSGCTATASGTSGSASVTATATVTLANASGSTCKVSPSAATVLTINGLTNPTTPQTLTGAGLGQIATSVAGDTTLVPAINSETLTPVAPTISTTPVAVTQSASNAAVNAMTISIPAADVGTFVSTSSADVIPVALTLPSGDNWDVTSGMPTVQQTNGAATTASGVVMALYPQISSNSTNTNSGVTVALTGTASSTNPTGIVAGNTLVFGITGPENTSANQPLTVVLTGLHVDAQSTAGSVSASLNVAPQVATTSAPSSSGNSQIIQVGTYSYTSLASATLFNVGATQPAAIYGQSADATTAQVFDAAFFQAPTSSATASCKTSTAIIATDLDPYDALAASYLEGLLHTGVLITPYGSAGQDMLNALKLNGITSVYVIGGPDAVSNNVISTLKSTSSYNCGGYATTGTLQVYGPIYGQTADDTAVALDNYVSASLSGNLPSVAGAYSASSTTSGGGLYNQTTGNATVTAPSGTQTTAIVASDTDFRDVMAASGLAYMYHLPVILTPPTALGLQASGELSKLGITQALVLGGNLAFSNNAVTQIQAMGISVLRIAGADYTQTAADLATFEAAQLGWNDSQVLVAQGQYWSDALSAAALSAGVTPSTGLASKTTAKSVLLTLGPTQGVGSYTDAALKMAGSSTGLAGSNPPASGNVTTTTIQVLGGPLAVTAAQTNQMLSDLSS